MLKNSYLNTSAKHRVNISRNPNQMHRIKFLELPDIIQASTNQH